ncbi:Polysaccharide pyruvyl transferase family protein WcaK [Loktanella fryxellensis]|uniref:Polysaccharide pyruvyl transferase family protein WcaK n=1 Tax=Loktanella fryxellensis TaxID=245187 RepID=A0A1H8H5H8_9RHOB|nr:polysaccharide pyruvyl transferase family protein [Loktanella fryxellensis]SEN51270.1 Polysaccharide pyruvyl transferase family protein WcaK [Loktanella fryxellensis]
MKNIVICSGDLVNVGDLALLLSCVSSLRQIPGLHHARISSYNWNSPTSAVRAVLDANDIHVLNGKTLSSFANLGPETAIIWGGGQLIRDNSSVASLVALGLLSQAVRLSGGLIAVMGCGIGPIGPLRQTLYRWMLKGAAMVALRDETSLARALRLVDPRVCVRTADLIFGNTTLQQALSHTQARRRIVIASCMDTTEDRCIDVAQIHDIVAEAGQIFDLHEVTFCSHDGRADMDPVVHCDYMAQAEMPEDAADHVAPGTVAQAVTLYRTAGLVVTNRMHAALFGLMAGSRVIVLDDGNAKMQDIARMLRLTTLPSDCRDKATISAALQAADARQNHPDAGAWFAAVQQQSELNFTILATVLAPSTALGRQRLRGRLSQPS